jgi:protein pelota
MLFSSEWRRHLHEGREGWIRVTPEDSDDIWALYNIISAGDEVESVTMRKVLQENNAGDVVDSHKVKVVLAVIAEKIDVDIKGASMRVNGKNVKENKFVKLGSYHTLDLEPGRDVKISKSCWDAVSLEFLGSSASSNKAEVGAVQFCDGLGFVCQLNPASGVRILQRVQVAMPKKKLGSTSTLEKAQEKFYTGLVEAALQHLNFASLRAVIIAAPGAMKDDFHKYLIDHLQKAEMKGVLEHKNKLMRIALPGSALATNLNPHNLLEILKEPRLADLLTDTKAASEIRLMESFQKCLANDPDRCTYGQSHIKKAVEECAVKHLLLSDSLFRSHDVSERKMYGRMMATVKENGGEVMIFSAGSKPTEELDKLTGIAALLNFPIDLE